MSFLSTLLGGGTTKTSQTTTPWGPQADALKSIFGDAANVYNSQAGTPYYQGDLYAKMNPLTGQGINANAGYATGAGANTATSVANASNPLLAGGLQGMDAYAAMARLAGGDTTGQNINAALAYSNNPAMNGMIDAASQDVRRNLTENMLPEIDREATATGNINSSRAGVASGIAMRGAQDTIGNIAANLRGQAYNNGLSLAEQSRQANMSGYGAAGSGFNSIFGSGVQGAGAGMDMNYQNGNALISGGNLFQQDQQGQDTANFNQWQGQDQRATDLLSRYYGIVGANNWGGTTNGTMTQPAPGLIQLGIGAASAAKGLGAFSDRRLKRDIHKVGKLADGLGVYSWRYRDDAGLDLPKGTQFGVMADEVERLRPHALGPVVSGYQTVNYDRL